MDTFPLTELPKGQVACIDAIVPSAEFGVLDGEVSRRLADLGVSGGMGTAMVSHGRFGHGT